MGDFTQVNSPMNFHGGFYPSEISPWIFMGGFTRVKSPMNFHGGFYPSGNTLDYKMTHWLFTLFQIISNILTSSLLTFSVIYTFYFYIASEGLKIYQKYLKKRYLTFLFLRNFFETTWTTTWEILFLRDFPTSHSSSCCLTAATFYHEPPEEANLIKSFKHKLKSYL